MASPDSSHRSQKPPKAIHECLIVLQAWSHSMVLLLYLMASISITSVAGIFECHGENDGWSIPM